MGRGTLKKRFTICLSFYVLLGPIYLSYSGQAALAKKAPAGQHGMAKGSVHIEQAEMPSSPAKPDAAPPAIIAFEQRLFFRTFNEDQLTVRIERIEKHLFGQIMSAPFADRLDHIVRVLQEQQADDLRNKQLLTAQPQSQSAPSASGRNNAPNNNRASPVELTPSDGEEAMDRARSAIQAARDEELAGLLAEGVNLYRAKRGMQAIERFEQALRLDPNNAEAHFNMGIIEESMGNFVEALSSYKQAARQQADNKEYQEAVVAVEQKANRQQKTSGHRADLRQLADSANSAWKRGEYLSALDLYQQLDAKEPNRALVKYNIGSIFLMLKDQKQALAYYMQANKIAPTEPKYRTAYENLAATQSKVQQAQAQIDQATQADYANAEAVPVNKGKKNKGLNKKLQASSSAPYMMTAGNPNMAVSPSGQSVQGRPSFGVPAGLSRSFTGTQAGAIGGMAAMQNQMQNAMQNQMQNPGITMMPQGNQMAGMQQQQPQQQAESTMLSYGMIGKSNNQGGVTLVTIGMASRAASAGLMPGDVVQTVDGYQVSQPDEIGRILLRINPSQRIPLVIMRNGALAIVNM